ncbi:MAG: hypothetical protein PF689_04950 [Deltaproteobacteria bacterium]|jgi:hypothetical protein|nr:hypothetical protein [Deltaproteobacteria bacterium]
MNNKLSWAIGGSILLHILAYIFLLNVDAEYKNTKKDWTVYKKKEEKVKFKPKKKKKKKKEKKKKPEPKKKTIKKKKVVKKRKTKPKPKPQQKTQQKLDLTAGLDANSFGGSGISIPVGTTMADPNAPKEKKIVVKKPEKKVEKKKEPVKRKPATLKRCLNRSMYHVFPTQKKPGNRGFKVKSACGLQ